MSIGPSSKAQKETSITSMRVVAGSAFHSLKKNPAGVLFYFGTTILLIGLPLGVTFQPEYYLTMVVLGGLALAQFGLQEDPKKKK